MKTNFKTLALQAGIGAALAAGSMSASAVITAVPAPAQLIPLFYYSGSASIGGALDVDTAVRVVVPKSVGADTVINIMRGDSPLTPNTNWNSQQQFATTNQIHYWVMDVNSAEIHNDKFTVTPDDEVYFYASDVLRDGITATGSNLTAILPAGVGPGAPTYLILTNESATNGGAPNFMFAADAWLENDGQASSMASAVTIPVLGLADAADATSYPTPGNNVIEAYSGSARGPIASPIHTGIRTSGTADVADLRVVEVPVFGDSVPGDSSNNTIVAWTDANNTYSNIKLYNVNSTEGQVSRGTTSLPNQLNFLEVNYNQGCASGTNLACDSSIGITDGYSVYLGDTNLQNGGFVKMVIPAVTLPTDWTEAGSYNSVVMFNIPSVAPFVAGTVDTDGSELAIDTGWFTGQ